MEVDVIILPKEGSKYKLQLGMKQTIRNVFKKIYSDVKDESFQFDLDGEYVEIKYQLSSKNANMLFAKFECKYTPVKSAKVLDCCINKLIRGEHRKDWNIVITYDEVSQLYCCKLMPLFGTFERRTRELVYITIIKIFGVDWYEKSFSESLQNTLKSKRNKTELVEGALNELTYEQLKEYLFVPFSNQNLAEVLEGELAKNRIESLSKKEIASIIDKCRSVSLWDKFFGEYKKFQNFKEKIDELQLYRNTVMHHKRITQQKYAEVRKSLKAVNKLLVDAINVLEEHLYTETRLVDVVSALGNLISNILGGNVPKWGEMVNSALASLGSAAIEAAMPRINISDIMPQLTLGTELTRRFQNVYNVPQISSAIESANALYNSPAIEAANALYNRTEIRMANEMAEWASRLETMCKIPGIRNARVASDALNTPTARMANKLAAQVSSIKTTSQMPVMESITATADLLNSSEKSFSTATEDKISEDLEPVQLIENDEEKMEVDLDVSADENH